MKKGDLIEVLKKMLRTKANLDFLLKLEYKELEILLAIMRDRLEPEKK
ncbi:MAG: hypothetical protein ABSF48_24540 [Thermodesulfobacteriota bacterium]|jgi:hypothetical protein